MEDKDILILFEKEPDKALGLIYDKYVDYLYKEVYFLLRDEKETEDVVQELFLELWKKHKHLKNIKISLKYYLKRAATNRALNSIKKQKYFVDIDSDDILQKEHKQHASMEFAELQDKIKFEINNLPDKCRVIFSLSRYEEMSYKEISKELDISLKTVENQISKALRILRKKINH